MYNEETEQSKHISEYYDVLTKHKWLIVVCFILAGSLTMLHNSQLKPVYRATATMVIESEQRRSPVTGQMMDYEGFYFGSIAFNTHCQLITSHPVMERVIKDLKMDQLESPEEMEVSPWKQLLSRLKENIRLLLGKKEKLPLPTEKRLKLRRILAGKIDVTPVKDTLLLQISAEDYDPLVAQRTVNSLAKAYIEFNIENRLKSSRNTLSWMTDQLYEMKKKLEDAEEAFLAYKQREKLFSMTGKQQAVSQKMADFNDAYIKARNRRLQIDARLAEISRSFNSGVDVVYARSLIQNPLINNLYTQILDAEVELSRLSKVFKSKHPKIIRIKSTIDKTEKKLKDEVNKEVDNLKSESSVLLSREKVLQKTIAEFENEALATNRKELKYTILERNVQTNQKLYDTLLSKVKESNIMESIDVSNIRIAEEARVPAGPVKPNKNRNLTLGALFGLVMGIVLAFFWEYLDRSLRTEEDVQRYLGLPVLSVIPKAENKGHRA